MTLNPSGTNIMNLCTLKHYFKMDQKDVKKLLTLEAEILDSKDNLPSCAALSVLVDHIWSDCWKEFQIEKKKKELAKKKKKEKEKNNVESSDEDSEKDDADKEQAATVPQSNDEVPEFTLDGKWYPPGFPLTSFMSGSSQGLMTITHLFMLWKQKSWKNQLRKVFPSHDHLLVQLLLVVLWMSTMSTMFISRTLQ